MVGEILQGTCKRLSLNQVFRLDPCPVRGQGELGLVLASFGTRYESPEIIPGLSGLATE